MNLQARVVIAIVVVAAIMIGAMFHFGDKMNDKNAEDMGFDTAKAVSATVGALRRTYTAHVVTVLNGHQKKLVDAGKITKDERLRPNFDFLVYPETTVPLPASMVKFLGETMAKEYGGARIRLYSGFPFPNRTKAEEKEMDTEETNAWEMFSNDNTLTEHKAVGEKAGKKVVRYFVPDKMQKGCLDCHNTRPDSPTNPNNPNAIKKLIWKEGDVRGVVEVEVPIGDVTAAGVSSNRNMMTLAGGGAVLLILVILIVLQSSLAGPLGALASAVSKVEQGDLTVSTGMEALRAHKGEVGRVAEATLGLLDRMRKMIKEMKENNDQMLSMAGEDRSSPLAKKVLRNAELQKEVLNRFTI